MGSAPSKALHQSFILLVVTAVLSLTAACSTRGLAASAPQSPSNSPTPAVNPPEVATVAPIVPTTPVLAKERHGIAASDLFPASSARTSVLPVAGSSGQPETAATAALPAAPNQPAWDLHYSVDCGSGTSLRAARPAWGEESPAVPAPDGRAFAISRNRNGEAALVIYAANGREPVRIPAPDAKFPLSAPVWSPDGQRLAFANIFLSQAGGGVVYVVNRDGSGLAALVSYVGHYDGVAWSPDGVYIAFSSGTIVGRGSGMQVTNYKVLQVAADGSGSPGPLADGCIPVAPY